MKQLPPGSSHAEPSDGPTLVAIPLWSMELPTTSLSADDRANLAQLSTIVHFRRGDVIHGEERANAIFIIASGVAKSFKILENGHTHVIGFAFVGDLIGVAERWVFIESASAVTGVLAYRISITALERIILSNPSMCFQLMKKTFHRIRDLQRHAIF